MVCVDIYQNFLVSSLTFIHDNCFPLFVPVGEPIFIVKLYYFLSNLYHSYAHCLVKVARFR